MLVLDIMLVALAQSATPAPADTGLPAPTPDVEVVGPTQPHNRAVCRTINVSNSRIPTRRVGQTLADLEEERDQAQSEAERDLASTMRRSDGILERSGYGNWIRSRSETPMGVTSVAQTGRGN